MTQHPDIVALEGLSAGEADAPTAEHVHRCAECSRLVAELHQLRCETKDLAAAPVPVPEEIDRRILWTARKQALEVRRSARRPRRWTGGVAAAAAVLLAGLATMLQLARDSNPAPIDVAQTAPITGSADLAMATDVDGDGRVDILDAFALARAIDRRAGVDVNGDGDIDDRDVDVVAQRAVALGGAS